MTAAVWNAGAGPADTDPEDYKEDYKNRFIKLNEEGVDDSWAERTESFLAPTDIAGYNYLYKRYTADHEKYPNRVIWGSETHALTFYDSWQAVKENSYVLGDFTWTAYDNLGEAGTGWHWYDVLDTWTFEEEYLGKPIKCDVYTDADEIEWFLNGRSQGRSIPEKAIATFDIPYEKGEISVIAYKNGVEYGRSALKTVGAPAAVKVVRRVNVG